VKTAGLAGCIAVIAMSVAGHAVAGSKAFSAPVMAPPKLDAPSAVVNPRFDTMKARSMVQLAERGVIKTVDMSGGGGLAIIDTKVTGDLLILPPSTTSGSKKP
jgi:hypothetical protein